MRACWMFIILVGCRFSHATQSQSTCACNYELKKICVPAGENVSVPCPKRPGEMVKYNLLQDEEIIYNNTCNHETDATNCNPQYYRVGVELHEDTENKSVSYVLTGVNVSSHGIYRCESIVMFPPPLKTVPSDLRILVLVEGHQCNKVCRIVEKPEEPNWFGFHWILIIVLLVSLYGIIITVIAIVIWVKLRKTDSQSDYMNTKPKASRDRRKKRGVQNPIPRYF